MTAATKPIDTPEREGVVVSVPVTAAAKLWAGTIAAITAATGFALPGDDAAGLLALGRVEEDVDNTDGANGDLNVKVKRGVFRFANSDSDAVTAAHVGQVCYVEDDNTVASASNNAIIAGIVVEVDDLGVWVDTRFHLNAAAVPEDASVTLAKLANAVADLIAGVSVTVEDQADGTAVITLQLLDAQGNALAARGVVSVYFSATAYGAPTDLGDVAAGTGAILAEPVTDALILVQTDATGAAVLTYTRTVDGELHAMAEVAGLSATDSDTVSGN